jgi:uncharacterized protein (TIGR03084 family)
MTETKRVESVVGELVVILAQLGRELDDLLTPLPEADWLMPTPAEGWTIAHQIGHLAWTDRQSVAALRDPAAFEQAVEAANSDPHGFVEAGAREGVADAGGRLLSRWQDGRQLLTAALEEADPGAPVPWFGPPMKPASMATARIMETFAHGLDITDALGQPPGGLVGLKQVCHLGVRTCKYAFLRRDLEAPGQEFRVELRGPDGEDWAWGPASAEQSVRGSALDFAMLVTRRRHRVDLDLNAEGPDADRWLDIAQAFAGPAGSGRSTRKSASDGT